MLNLIDFVINFIDTTAVMFIWCNLSLPWRQNLKNIMLTVLIVSIIGGYTYNLPYSILISHISFITAVFLLFRKPFKETIIEFVTIVAAGNVVIIPIFLILSFFIGAASNPTLFPLLLTTLFTISVVIIIRYLPIKSLYNRYKSILEKVVYALIGITILSYMFDIIKFNGMDNIIIGSILFLSFILVNFAFIQSLMESKEQKELMLMYEQHKNMIIPLMDEIRSKQHDFKNHLTAIYGFCQQSNDTKEISKYIEKLNYSLKTMDSFLHIKDKVLGAIIYSKACEAESKKIEFDISLPSKDLSFPFEDYEYTAVVCNLLDNAAEAVSTGDSETKKMYLKLGLEENLHYIEVWNNGPSISTADIPKLFKKGFSTKKYKTGHGYGLYTVKTIVDKYKGVIEVSLQDSYTVFRVAFPLTKTDSCN